MRSALNTEALKFAGGAIIVGAAACILMPDLLRYLAGLWRLAIFVIVVVLAARAIAIVVSRRKTTAADAGDLSSDGGQKAPTGDRQTSDHSPS